MRILLMAWLLAFATAACADDSIERARAVFEACVDGYRCFDSNVVELSADAAIVQNTRRYPMGEVRQIRVPAPQYKAMVAQFMPEMRGSKQVSRPGVFPGGGRRSRSADALLGARAIRLALEPAHGRRHHGNLANTRRAVRVTAMIARRALPVRRPVGGAGLRTIATRTAGRIAPLQAD